MNILFISTENPYPPDHGHHIRTYNVLKGLAAQNTIYFVGFAKSEEELKYKPEIEKFCASADIFHIDSGWRFWLLLLFNVFSRRPFITHRYMKEEARKRIAEIMSKKKIDLVHIDLLHVSPYCEPIAKVPKILVNHNVESVRFLRRLKTEPNPLKKFYFYYQYLKLRHYEKHVSGKFDWCVVVSETDKKMLAELSGDRNFVVVPNGVDVDYFHPNGALVRANSLIWVGSMQSPYNADAVDYFLRDIWPHIKAEIPDVIIHFVGASPTKLLQKTASEDKNIRVLGYVEDVRPFMAEAAVFVAPIRSGSGTKIKVLNAMAMKMPVITTAVGAEGINAVNHKDILIADDHHDFAFKTIQMLRNPDRAKELGENGRKVIETHYDWNAIHKKTHKLYKLIVNQKEKSQNERRVGG